MAEKIFDPNKARQMGSRDVENVPLSDDAVRGNIARNLQDLTQILKGVSPADFDEVFRGVPLPMLEHFQSSANQMSTNLNRIVESRRKENKE
ncbi:MAG: hypothetical protein AAB665_00880 [Patescibacteria group bacterium]